jgi:hypothetical protein
MRAPKTGNDGEHEGREFGWDGAQSDAVRLK